MSAGEPEPAQLESLIVVGPSPPPVHGVSLSIERMVGDAERLGALAEHVDTRDSRVLETVGKLDAVNVLLGLRHTLGLARAIVSNRGAAVYVPLSQTRWALYRDLLFTLIARLARRRVYLHLHGSHIGEVHRGSGPVLRRVIRLICRSAHRVWVLTPGLAATFAGLVDQARIRVLSNAVADPLESHPARAESAPASLRLLFLANLQPGKGAAVLLEALAHLGDRARGWEVWIAGGSVVPDHDAELERRAAELTNPEVVFLGAVDSDRRAELLSGADVLVVPSTGEIGEGQPLALLEALAASLPVVASDVGGIGETVEPGFGVLVPPRDPAALAAALADLAQSPPRRESMSERARETWAARYAPERHLEALRQLLDLDGDAQAAAPRR